MTRAARSTVVFGLLAACACATAPVQQGDAHEREIAVVVRRIDEARAQRGMSPSQPLYRLAPDMQRLAAAFEGGQDPHRSLQDLLQKAIESLGGGTAFAWIGAADHLEELDVPEMLVTPRALRVAVGIARCRPDPGRPSHESYCALVAAVQQMGSVMGAAQGGPGRG